MDFQRVRASRSFAEHLGSCQEPVDLLGQAEEPQAVARAQDRVGGEVKRPLAHRGRHGHGPDSHARARTGAPGLSARRRRTASRARSVSGTVRITSAARSARAAARMIRWAASPKTAGTPRARRLLTMSGSVSIATYGTPNVSNASPMALPTRPNPQTTTWPWSAPDDLEPAAGAGAWAWARRARPIHIGTSLTSAALIRIVTSDAASVAL